MSEYLQGGGQKTSKPKNLYYEGDDYNMAKVNAQPASEFKDDEFRVLETSIEAIQTCPGMYLAGEHIDEHPLKELTNNALDECINPQSPGNKITVLINENTHEQIVTDNGRGLPHEKMVEACTKNHASTKFGRVYNKWSAGQNGVGLKVCVATSSYLSMESTRRIDNQTISKTIEFNDCVMEEHEPVVIPKKNIHGTTVKFVPNEKYLGPFELTVDRVHDYLRHLSYCKTPRPVEMELIGYRTGDDKPILFTFQQSNVVENVKYLSPSLEFPPIAVESVSDDVELYMAFSYDKTVENPVIDSYANYVITTEHGHHEDVFINVICSYFTREAKRLDPNHQYEVVYDDCKKGLVMAVDLHHIDPKFEGQHKSKVGNKAIREECRPGLMDSLQAFFSTNTTLLRKIISYLRQIAKIRLDANKIKGIDTKATSTFMDDADIYKYHPLKNRNSRGYSELLIGEGNSATDQLCKARNPEFQAIFTLRGVIPNVVGMTLHQAMSYEILRNLIRVIGCGVGKEFDVNKCRFNKIIIATDGDTDGDHIASLIISFFYLFFPEIINKRILYRVIPPLYVIDSKSAKRLNKKEDDRYFYDKRELVMAKNKRIAETTDIRIFPDGDDGEPVVLNKHAKIEWLMDNRNYLMHLNNAFKRTGTDPEYLEMICECILLSGYDPSNPETYPRFEKKIKEHFPETTFYRESKSIAGSHKGDYIALIVDELFIHTIAGLLKAVVNAGTFEVEYYGRGLRPDHGRVSVGKFLEITDAGIPLDIEQRYKGLGEISVLFLFISTMNPNIRRLLCVVADDAEKAVETITVLHGKSDKMREKRRELLEQADYTIDDLDN